MAYSDMIDAMKAYVILVVEDEYDVQMENESGFEKPDDGAWARCVIRVADSKTICIGAVKTYRMSGILELQCFNPLGTDETNINYIINDFLDDFAYLRLVVGDSEGTIVKFIAPFSTVIGRVEGEYQVNVTCPWEADFRAPSKTYVPDPDPGPGPT